VDYQLSVVCQEIFRVGPTDIISFTEWTRTTNQVRKVLDSNSAQWHDDRSFYKARTSLDAADRAVPRPGNYLETLILNGLLAPSRQRVASSQWFDTAVQNEDTAPQFLASLATAGVSELGFANWRHINKLLNAQPLPSSVPAREEIPGFQVPFAGSKPLKAISIENFQKLCYGAAAMIIGETAVGAASAVGHGAAPTLVAVLGGSVSALIFVSVGSLSRFLEEYLRSKSSLSSAPTTTKKIGGRRASAA